MKLLPKTARRKLVSLLVIIFLTGSLLYPIFVPKVNAGTFQDASLTISDSRSGATSVQYDFAITAQASTDIKQVDIYFCTTATGACVAPTGMNTGTPTLGSDNISGTGRTLSKIAAGDNTARIVVTTPDTQDPLTITMSFTGITNTTTDDSSVFARVTSYSDLGVTEIDSATMATAVLASDSIYVTATVASIFTFTVTAATTGTVNSESVTETSTTDSTIPFGVLTADTAEVAAHDIDVATNANNGYTVTVEADASPPLVDGATGNNIDEFTGTNGSPTTWSAPVSTTENVNTGFFGYTTEDSTLTVTGDGADRFTSSGGNKWAGSTTSPLEVVYNAAAPGGSGETTRVGWQLEVNTYQPPGDYTGSVVLIATPTY